MPLSPKLPIPTQLDAMEDQALAKALLELRLGGSEADPVMTSGIATLNFAPLRNRAREDDLTAELGDQKKRREVSGAEALQRALLEQRRYQEARATNPQAYLEFEYSPDPSVQAQAKADRKAYENLVEKAVPKASLQSLKTGKLGDFTDEEKKTVQDGVVFDLTPGKTPGVAAGGYTQETGPNGETLNRNKLTNELKGASRGTTVNVNNSLNKKAGEVLMEGLPKQTEAAEKWNQGIRSAEGALEALREGAQAGYGVEFVQNARTLVSLITGAQFDASTPTAVLAKELAKGVIAELGSLGAQVSDADRRFMEKAAGGQETDPKALERILAIKLATLQRGVSKHNAKVDATTGLLEPDLGAAAQLNNRVERTRSSFRPRTIEAEAAYLANLTNIPYEQALQQVKAMKPDYSDGAAKPAMTAAEALEYWRSQKGR